MKIHLNTITLLHPITLDLFHDDKKKIEFPSPLNPVVTKSSFVHFVNICYRLDGNHQESHFRLERKSGNQHLFRKLFARFLPAPGFRHRTLLEVTNQRARLVVMRSSTLSAANCTVLSHLSSATYYV